MTDETNNRKIFDAIKFLEEQGVIRRYSRTVAMNHYLTDIQKPEQYRSMIQSHKLGMFGIAMEEGIISKNHKCNDVTSLNIIELELMVVVPPFPRYKEDPVKCNPHYNSKYIVH